MQRREVLQVATATALAHSLVSALGCGAAPTQATPESPKPEPAPPAPQGSSPVTEALARAAEAAAHCAVTGEICLEHCIRDLSSGSRMMADCAKVVQQMIPLCRALASLAAMGSPYAKEVAALCSRACAECHAECKKHAGHHKECKACAEACAACKEACDALV